MEDDLNHLRLLIEKDRKMAEWYANADHSTLSAVYTERADALDRIIQRYEQVQRNLSTIVEGRPFNRRDLMT